MNTWRQLRCSAGLIRHYVIDQVGNIRCVMDPTMLVPVRIQGKRKQYRQAQLMRGGVCRWYYVHRLMGFSWLGDPPHPKRRIIDHRNGDSLCNNIDNLRWVTTWANNVNRVRKGQIVQENGFWHPVVAGHDHFRFRSKEKHVAEAMRSLLIESYVRYSMRFPDCNSVNAPHKNIHQY